MIEKRIRGATGYAPGKNPNSHKRNAIQQRRERIQDQMSGLHERLSKIPGATAKAARAHIETASDRLNGLNHKEALQYYRRARKMINHLAAGHRKSVIGKAEEVMKGKSGYGPGNNPNSHKKNGRAMRNKLVMQRSAAAGEDKDLVRGSLGNVRDYLKLARKAKKSGSMGETSYYARQARGALRIARGSSSQGLKETEGSSLFIAENQALRGKQSNMRLARVMSSHGNKAGTSKFVREARRDNKEHVKYRNKARMTKRDETDIFVPIVKADAKEQVVYGWASPIKELGSEIIDRQGDVIDMSEVRQAAHEFMLHKRVGGSMHKQFDAGQVVESIVFDADIQKALGIDLPYEGWFIGVKVSKKEDWDKVVSGEYTGFSIGGSGIREPVEEEVTKNSKSFDEIFKVRGASGYAPGKNPNSHRRNGLSNRTGDTSLSMRDKRVARSHGDPEFGNKNAAYSIKEARKHMVNARAAKKSGDKGAASYYANEARKSIRIGRKGVNNGEAEGLKRTAGADAFMSYFQAEGDARSYMRRARRAFGSVRSAHVREAKASHKEAMKYRSQSRVTKRSKSGYAPGKNPNSHKRSGFSGGFNSGRRTGFDEARSKAATGDYMGALTTPISRKKSTPMEPPRGMYGTGRKNKHLKEAKDWMSEARDVKGHDPDQAAYAVMQARKAVRRARGASTKTGSGKSTLARAARRFATQSVDGR